MAQQLTEKEYKSTMTQKMVEVTTSTEPVVDIWPYAQLLVEEKVVLDYVYQNNLVEHVYRNEDNSFHHVLLPTDNKNIFIAIIVSIKEKNIKGHFKLNLNMEYGFD